MPRRAGGSNCKHRTKSQEYRVKVQYQDVSDAGKKQKREAVAQVIVQAMRRMKQGI
ncbi:MAG: hypothetical protein HY276_01605 [Ignavibacteriales bacterium]|nr:hypothetical protein [Ignavibacteriales bacterium]